jgi:hypothetical protein
MAKKNPFVVSLEGTAKKLGKVKPAKAYELLHRAFLVFATAGDVEHAGALVRLIYAGALPRPTTLANVFGSGPVDGFSAAAKLGDLTKGDPPAPHVASARTLDERVRRHEMFVRARLTGDAYLQFPTPQDHWNTLEGRELWRRAQILARFDDDGIPPRSEGEALEALTKYMDGWCAHPDERGAGFGQEVSLAFDLAIRHGATDRVTRWLPALGPRLLDWGMNEPLCLPHLARAVCSGLLRRHIGLTPAQETSLYRAIEEATNALAQGATPSPEPAGKPALRRVTAQDGQFYLEHATSPKDQVFFQDDRESPQGMSIFATKVGLATPSETGECFIELSIPNGTSQAKAPGVVQAVSFPFVVTGPLFVRSINGGGDDEERDVVLPNGSYDVLARFFSKRATKRDAEAGLRAFRVTLDFHPAGTLGTPECIALEHGEPPKKIFVNH